MSYRLLVRTLAMAGAFVAAGWATAFGKGQWYDDWEMEDRVAQAQLILVARVTNVSAVTIMHGGKAAATIREYRFQPARRLKGVFGRDELAMTSSDLGVPEGDGSTVPPLAQGEWRLLLLARTAAGFSCVAGPQGTQSPDQQVPRLSGPRDPLVAMTEALVQVSELPSRKARGELLVKLLRESSGPAAVPLLASLARRAVWAAQLPGAAEPLSRLAVDKSPAVRLAAVRAIGQILAAEYLDENSDMLGVYAQALQKAESRHNDAAERVAVSRAIGHLGDFGGSLPWPSTTLVERLDAARTHAERDATATALADLNQAKSAEALLHALRNLLLDETQEHEESLASAAVRLAAADALPVLLERLEEKLVTGQSPVVEIRWLGELKSPEAIPLLLKAARPQTTEAEAESDNAGDPAAGQWEYSNAALHETVALARAFEQIKDERAVPALSAWLRSPSLEVREHAARALGAIDSESAVAAVRLRLKPEPHLPLKLHLATILGRHGIDDGYHFAIEHIADPGITEFAAAALAAIGSEQTRKDLWAVLETSHDRGWNGAALFGLAAVHDKDVKPRIDEILGNSRHPLLANAALAAGELGDRELLPRLAPLVGSRNGEVAAAAIRAIGKLCAGDDGEQQAVHDSATPLVDLLTDPDASLDLRVAALNVLSAMNDDRLPAALKSLADQPELEHSVLLANVEHQLARGKIQLAD